MRKGMMIIMVIVINVQFYSYVKAEYVAARVPIERFCKLDSQVFRKSVKTDDIILKPNWENRVGGLLPSLPLISGVPAAGEFREFRNSGNSGDTLLKFRGHIT
jgi:hypothetical protein